MKKHNLHGRRARALDRLSTQIKERRMSAEFHNKIVNMPVAERNRNIEMYWERKDMEKSMLEAKISRI